MNKAILQKIASTAYDPKSPMWIADGIKLILKTPTLVFYEVENRMIIVGVRGTFDARDVKTDATIPFNKLAQTARFKEDVKTIMNFQKKKPLSQYEYIGVGHSLGGAIIDELITMGLINGTKNLSYNPAVQPKDLSNKRLSAVHHRVYNSDDPMYRIFGSKLAIKPEVRKRKLGILSSLVKAVSHVPGMIGLAAKGAATVQEHGIASFEGGNVLQRSKTATSFEGGAATQSKILGGSIKKQPALQKSKQPALWKSKQPALQKSKQPALVGGKIEKEIDAEKYREFKELLSSPIENVSQLTSGIVESDLKTESQQGEHKVINVPAQRSIKISKHKIIQDSDDPKSGKIEIVILITIKEIEGQLAESVIESEREESQQPEMKERQSNVAEQPLPEMKVNTPATITIDGKEIDEKRSQDFFNTEEEIARASIPMIGAINFREMANKKYANKELRYNFNNGEMIITKQPEAQAIQIQRMGQEPIEISLIAAKPIMLPAFSRPRPSGAPRSPDPKDHKGYYTTTTDEKPQIIANTEAALEAMDRLAPILGITVEDTLLYRLLRNALAKMQRP